MHRTHVSIVALALALWGCADFIGAGERDLDLVLQVQEPRADTLTLGARVGLRAAAVRASGAQKSVSLGIPDFGEVPVRVALLGAAGDTLATAAFTQRFRRGSDHWISGVVGEDRPVGLCIGSQLAVPLQAAGSDGRDTLFLDYGSIEHDAMC